MATVWTPEHDAQLLALVPTKNWAEIARSMSAATGQVFTADQVRCRARRIDEEAEVAALAATRPIPPPDDNLETLAEMADRLYRAGHDFRIEDGKLLFEKAPVAREDEVVVDLGKEHIRIAVVSDTHGGSHSEQLTALRHFYRYADECGVDAFIHGGDFTQGSDRMHPDQPYQVHAHGSDQQVDYVVATYPRSERDVPTYAISGNHDDSFLKDAGTNVIRLIAQRRPDIKYLGQTASYLTIGGLKTYLTHPRGGAPYAKSYRLQKACEALPISRQVNLLLMGHLHSYCVVQEHGITGLLLPAFQSQYGWMAAGSLHPAIGGLIFDIWLTDNGEVARVAHEFVRYQARPDDWDHEISGSIAHGWTPEGLAS